MHINSAEATQRKAWPLMFCSSVCLSTDHACSFRMAPCHVISCHVQVVSLIKHMQASNGCIMWAYEDASLTNPALPSSSLLTSLVQSVVGAIFFQVSAARALCGWC